MQNLLGILNFSRLPANGGERGGWNSSGASNSLARTARHAISGMDDSGGIGPKVEESPEELLAIPWFEILLHSRRPSRLAGIWKCHGETHSVKTDHNFRMSGWIVFFLRTSKWLSLIVPLGTGELQRDGGTCETQAHFAPR
jgi:hypothetical protein